MIDLKDIAKNSYFNESNKAYVRKLKNDEEGQIVEFESHND